MSWLSIARRSTSYAQAQAQAALDDHADPRAQMDQAVDLLKHNHDDMQAAASSILAQEKGAKQRIADLSAAEARFFRLALAASWQGDLGTARAFASRVASLRDQIRQLTAQIPQLEGAASDARAAVRESAERLQAKLDERLALLSRIGQAQMQSAFGHGMAAMAGLAGADGTPSFEGLKAKVEAQFARARADAELLRSNPGSVLDEIRATHAELTGQADSILAELTTGSLRPAALDAPAR